MTSQSLPMSAIPRESDPALHRSTVTMDCRAMAALCRPDHQDAAKSASDPSFLSDGVPLPIEEDSITQPYPNEVYAQMMMAAVTAAPEPIRLQRALHLPTGRRTHRQLMEALLMIAGAIVLPVVTIVSLHHAQSPPRSLPLHEREIVMQAQALPAVRESAVREPALSAPIPQDSTPSPSLEQTADQPVRPPLVRKREPKPVRAKAVSAASHSGEKTIPTAVPPAFEIEE